MTITPQRDTYDRRDGRIIPVRATQYLVTVTVAGAPHPLAPDHPMVDETCQVCGDPLGCELPTIGVVIGIAPDDRVDATPGRETNAAVVIVHDRCAAPARFGAQPD